MRLTPEDWPVASVESLSRRRWLVGYNLEAVLTIKLKWASTVLEGVRGGVGSLAVTLYVLSGHAWEMVQKEMRGSFAQPPNPKDGWLRASCRWLAYSQLLWMLQHTVLDVNDPRQIQLTLLLAQMRPIALLLIAFYRDRRHARLLAAPTPAALARLLHAPPHQPPPLQPQSPPPTTTLPSRPSAPPPASSAAVSSAAMLASTGAVPYIRRGLYVSLPTLAEANRLCQGAYTAGSVLRLTRSLALAAHAAAPEAAHAHPLVLRALDASITVCELVGMCMHVRIEYAGLRGLLILLNWAVERKGILPTITKVRPHESGLWARRYCVVEEFTPIRLVRGVQEGITARRGLRWEEALEDLRVPLRALLAFFGERGLHDRGFPLWAICDIRAIRMIEDSM